MPDNGLPTRIPVEVFRSGNGGPLLSSSRERHRGGEVLLLIVMLWEGERML